MNRSITDSSPVNHKIIFKILLQPKLIQTCFKQVSNVSVNYRTLNYSMTSLCILKNNIFLYHSKKYNQLNISNKA